MGTPILPSVDSETKQFVGPVRTRFAANLGDASQPEGAALVAAVGAAAKTGYSAVITSDGTDQTATINGALSMTVPTNTVRRIKITGSFSITGTLIIPSNTILDASGAVVVSTFSGNLIQNAAVANTGTRDVNVAVIGGTWDRGGNGGTGTGLHSLMFRRADGLRVLDVTVKSTAGKYAINVGDVTDFDIDRPRFATYSDGVHVNGPAMNGRIRHVSGTTGDDSVAITANDYPAYADVTGSVTNVLIENINTISSAANNVKVLAGQGVTCDDITVRRVRGVAAQHGVWLGDDNGYPATQNGTYGTITVADVAVIASQSGGGAQVFSNFLQGAKRVVLTDLYMQPGGTNKFGALIGFSANIDSLLVDRVRIAEGLDTKRAVTVQGGTSAVITDVELRHLYARGVTNFIGLEVKGCTGTSARLVDSDVITATAGGTDWVYVTTSATINRVVVAGGQITGGRDVVRAESTTTIILDGGLSVDTIDRVVNLYNAAITVIIGAVRVGTVTNRLLMANSGVTLMTILGGSQAELPATPMLYQRAAGTIPVRVNGAALQAIVSELTPVAYDQCTLAQAAGSVPAGAKVITNGTVWKDMFTGTTSS